MKFESLELFKIWLSENEPSIDDILGTIVIGMRNDIIEDFIMNEGEWIVFLNDKVVDGWLYW
jgi:hypothetical protein